MALDFPTSPNVGDTYQRWTWDGTRWVATPAAVSPDQAITGDLRVDGDTALLGNVDIGGDVQIDGDLTVAKQADFLDGVTIDGENAATQDWVDNKIDDLKNLGFFAGSFNTHADLPTNISTLPNLTVNDFVTVRADETHAGATTRYIATAIAGNGDILWTYDLTYSTDVSGKMDKVPTATAGNVAVFDAAGQVEDGGSIDASSLQFRPMTANLYNWIPVGLEGTFVGEGTNIANAPTTGTWRYLAFARASGSLDLIAFENNGGPMRASPSGQVNQRTVRKKRLGGYTLATDGWSNGPSAPGLPPGWGEYQRPLFSSETTGGPNGGTLMKISGRNLLQRVPGGNIQIGPRYSSSSPYRNPYNMNIDHRRLIYSGSGGDLNRLHVIRNIWNLRNDLRTGYINQYNRNDNNYERLPISINMGKTDEENKAHENNTTYRRWNGGGYVRMSVSIWVPWAGPNLTYNAGNARTFAVHRRIVIVDCRAMGAGSRWTNADSSSFGTPQTQVQGMAFNYPRQANIRVHHVGPTFDNSPVGKIFKIVIEVCPVFDTCMVTVFTYTAPLFSMSTSRPSSPGT